MLYLEELTPEKIVVIDSTKIPESGKFSIRKKAGKMNYYRLRLGKEQMANMYSSPNNVIVFISDSTEKITIEANGSAMNSEFKISGSKETDLLLEINAYALRGDYTIDSLNDIFQKTPDKFNKAEGEAIFMDVN